MTESILIEIRTGGTEERRCACGERYLLPIPYERCNPVLRDLCTDCISKLQREHDRAAEPEKKEIQGQDWFT